MNKPDPKIRATPRALRIAYVLEDGIDAHAWIDAIFSHCFSRDGGRQSLIIPLINGQISQRYKAWLRLLDPDFVVLLTYDNDSFIQELDDLLSDTTLVAQPRHRDRMEANPRIGIERPLGLTALSWLPFLKTVSGFQPAPPTHILDSYPVWDDDGLIKDNFGTLSASVSGFPMNQQIGLRSILLTPENPPENRWHFRAIAGDEVHDAYGVLKSLGSRRDIATLWQLANLRAQPHRLDHPWAEGFCLVIGDTFEDRISCWNAGLLFEDAQSQRYKTLRVPAASALNPESTARIGAFLLSANWLGSTNGPRRVFVRSHSINAAGLEEFVARLRESSTSIVTFAPILSTDDCCPADAAGSQMAFNYFRNGPAAVETAISGPTVALSAPQPMQLSYCVGLHPIFVQGAWLVDLSIDRLNDTGRFSNIREAWSLPSRRQLVQYFCEDEGARLKRFSVVSVPVTIESRALEIKQPEDSVVFRSLLTETSHVERRDLRSRIERAAPYKYAEPSDKGSYLQGLIGMFGSLSDIEHTMGTHFWRKQFEGMAAPAQNQRDEVIKELQLRMGARDGKLVINDEVGWQNLGNI